MKKDTLRDISQDVLLMRDGECKMIAIICVFVLVCIAVLIFIATLGTSTCMLSSQISRREEEMWYIYYVKQ